MTELDAATRRNLTRLARSRRTRTSAFTSARPTDWRPTQVRNPDGILDDHFTDSTAWELIASALADDHPVETVELRKPPGARGYVMLIDIEPGRPRLYVKVELGAGKVLGRSFHYSTIPNGKTEGGWR